MLMLQQGWAKGGLQMSVHKTVYLASKLQECINNEGQQFEHL